MAGLARPMGGLQSGSPRSEDAREKKPDEHGRANDREKGDTMRTATEEPAAQTGAQRHLARPRFIAAAGALLLLAGFIVFMGIITAEALYPEGYSTSHNAISDLGATEPPDSVSVQPSAAIFDSVMIVGGILALAGAFCLERGFRRMPVAIFGGLTGLGMLGVGVFPSNYGNVHTVFALMIFIAGGLAAIISVTVQTPPFSVISPILGIITLATLILYTVLADRSPMAGLGIGGVERWVAYPVVAWVMSFGGYLMGRAR